MIGRLLEVYRIVRQVFGQTFRPLFTGLLIIDFQLISRISWALDEVFFRRYRTAKVERPIFIIGNPRSGTTVMQRFLADANQTCSFQVWQMIVPSLLGQMLLRPFVPLFSRFNPARHYAREAHETSLDAVETDEALLSFRFLEGLFVFLFFKGWGPGDPVGELVESHAAGSDKNKNELAFYRKALQKNLYQSGKPRVLGKPFTFVLRIDDVLKEFPDARLIYMVRDPADVIPSGINMLRMVTDKQFKTSTLDQSIQQRYFNNLYRGEIALYRQFYDAWKGGRIPEENLMIVRFPDLMQNFEKVMDEIFAFTGFEVNDELAQQVAQQAEKQRNYKSKHRYDLQSIGLSREQIRQDLDFVYNGFEL
ncbi:MAG: sulfotransferase [Proteobacteria bacterium]|nr:sulfotransferase [Pseudomonadota bacterium]